MRMDKLTTKFQLALADAQSLALGRDHQQIEPLHVMIALLDQKGGTVRHLLTQSGVNINALRSQLGVELDRMARVEGGAPGDVQISQELGRVRNLTEKLAQKRKDQFISSELFVVAALDAKGQVADLRAATPTAPAQAAVPDRRELAERALELARRGHSVLLSTTDPAAHVAETIGDGLPNLTIDRIDPKAETESYCDLGNGHGGIDRLDAPHLL